MHLGIDVSELPTQEAEKAMVAAAHMEVVESSSTEVEPYELMEQGLFAASQMEDDREYGMVCRTAVTTEPALCEESLAFLQLLSCPSNSYGTQA